MKKWLKRIGIGLGVVVAIILGFVLYTQFSGFPTYEVQTVNLKVDVTPERVAQGKKLAGMLCIHCHIDPTTRRMTGKRLPDIPKDFGTVYSANITKHPEMGIGSWTDGELAFFLRTGIHPRRKGEYVPPYMPRFTRWSDEDLASVIAWLRSDDPRLDPDPKPNHPQEVTFLTKFLSRTVFKPMEYPTKPILRPDTTDMLALGRYVANDVIGCYGCHSTDFTKVDDEFPEKSFGYYAGGNPLLDINGNVMTTANITPDKETGIGTWTEDEFVAVIRDGFKRDGSLLRYPMLRHDGLTDTEMRAVYRFLRTVPPIKATRPPNYVYLKAQSGDHGERVYYTYGCVYCHGETGIGYGDLRPADMKYPADSTLIDVIYHTSKYYPETIMPSWEGKIKQEDLAPLLSHVRMLGKRGTMASK